MGSRLRSLLDLAGGRLSRRLTGVFIVIIAVLAVVLMAVVSSITTESIEARAESELRSDEAIVQLYFHQLEDDLVFLNDLLAGSQMLTEQMTGPSASRALTISLLSDLRHRGMTVRLYKRDLPPDEPRYPIVQKGLLGIRTLALVAGQGAQGWEAGLVSVAPIESRRGVEQVATISFPLTAAYLEGIAERIRAGITIVLPDGHAVSTLPENTFSSLWHQLKQSGAGLEKIESPRVLSTTLADQPTKVLVGPLTINLQNEGTLILTMPMVDLLAAKQRIGFRALVTTLALLAGASLMYLILIHRITKPLEQLSAATRDVAGGNLALQVRVASEDEIGDLATAFNRMVQRLQESRSEIERWNQTLEQRVEERTESLEKARSELKTINAQLFEALEEVQRTQSQMIRAEKLAALGQMASSVAHEVQNPLTGMKGALQVLVREGSCGDRAPVVQLVIEQIDRLSQTTSRLLSFARPATPRQVPTSLEDLINETHMLVSEQANQKGVQIVVDMEPTHSPLLLDPRLTVQAFLNIALNAVQAMSRGGTLTITSRWQRDTQELAVTFEDTGGGIPPDVLAKIFTPFFTTKTQGTGLGLHVAREIIEQQGGTIGVASTPGVGTVFTVRLPAQESRPAPAQLS